MPVLPILLALATPATVQDVKLEADTREAALTCGAALYATLNGAELPTSMVIQLTWLSNTAAKQVVPIEQVMQKSTKDLDLMGERIQRVRPNAAAILTQCRARFPQAWRESGVQLPADSFDRRSMCFVANLMVASYEAKGDREMLGRANERWGPLLKNEELEARGITSEEGYSREMGRVLLMSLPLGNLRGLVNACEVAFPG